MANTTVGPGETSTGAVIGAGDQQLVELGGIANAATVDAGGQQVLTPGAISHDTVVNSGGIENNGYGSISYDAVLNGGVQDLSFYIVEHGSPQFSLIGAQHTIINAGGIQNDGDRATGTVINSGGIQNVTGYATNTIINDGGVQNVDVHYLEGWVSNLVDNTVVNAGGIQNIVSGAVTNTHLMAGGSVVFGQSTYAAGGTASYDSGTHTLTVNDNGQTYALGLAGDYSGIGFALSSFGGHLEVTAEPLCFCRGTRILTIAGEIAVEQLAVGDLVVTHEAVAKPIVWLGSAVRTARAGERPLIVRADALAAGVPSRDLRVTGGHALLVGEVLIPAGELVNGISILWDDTAEAFEVFHVEVEGHDILVADGAPAESYRDDGNRKAFGSSAGRAGRETREPRMPIVRGGAIVDDAWRMLARRAGMTTLPLTGDADVHLMVDGRRIEPLRASEACYRFKIDRAAEVRLGSRSVIPAMVGTTRDTRRLGVALRRCVITGAGARREIDYDSPLLARAFYPAEHEDRLRWSDGASMLPQAVFAGLENFEIELEVGCTALYPA